jgi:Amt family ammonium transporter
LYKNHFRELMAIKTQGKIAALLLIMVSLLGVLYQPEAAPTGGEPLVPADVAWMLTSTALVLFMTPGLSFFYGGLVNSKNVVSTMLQSFIAMGIISLLWVVVGFSLAFGDSIGGVVGNPMTFFMFNGVGGATNPALSPTIPLALFALFQMKFAIITPALITGSFAERVKFTSYCIFITLFSLVIYCPLAHMTWHPEGILRTAGVLDFAGGTVVHMSAGFAALAGAMFLGRRKMAAEGKSSGPANIPYVVLGTGMLWFGWFGFNAGSALTAGELAVTAFLVTNTASAAAMLAWLVYDVMSGKKPSAVGACIGAVVGLVAITPAAGFVSVGASIFIGAAAAVISNMTVSLFSKTSVDDTLDVFPCHGVGGAAGMIMTALFATSGGLLTGGGTSLFILHTITLFAVMAGVVAISFVLYKITDMISPLRVTEDQEMDGLDASQHGEAAMSPALGSYASNIMEMPKKGSSQDEENLRLSA